MTQPLSRGWSTTPSPLDPFCPRGTLSRTSSWRIPPGYVLNYTIHNYCPIVFTRVHLTDAFRMWLIDPGRNMNFGLLTFNYFRYFRLISSNQVKQITKFTRPLTVVPPLPAMTADGTLPPHPRPMIYLAAEGHMSSLSRRGRTPLPGLGRLRSGCVHCGPSVPQQRGSGRAIHFLLSLRNWMNTQPILIAL